MREMEGGEKESQGIHFQYPRGAGGGWNGINKALENM